MVKVAAAGGEVLLVAHTRLSLGYVLDHCRLLRQDAGLRFALTRAPDQFPAGVEEMMNGPVLRRIPYCAAVRRSWDLALFGAHGSEIFFTAGARVHIQHGLGAGKLVDGQDYAYGPKWALFLWGFKTDLFGHLRITAAHDAVLPRLACSRCRARSVVILGSYRRCPRMVDADPDAPGVPWIRLIALADTGRPL